MRCIIERSLPANIMTFFEVFHNFCPSFLPQLFLSRGTVTADITVRKFFIVMIMIMITAWKVSLFGVFGVRIFPYLYWIWGDTPYLSVFSPNKGKYEPEKLQIRALFMQWTTMMNSLNGWPMKGVKPYFQLTPFSKVLIIVNRCHAASRIQTCRESEIRLCWRNLCSSYNQCYTS